VDHVVPKVHGGRDQAANLQSLCTRHHRRKTATEDRWWGTHVERPVVTNDAAGSVRARPGFPVLPGRPGVSVLSGDAPACLQIEDLLVGHTDRDVHVDDAPGAFLALEDRGQ
jgi:hypothetical protein